MSDHLIIYLDESGNLGFDFDNKNINQYFIIALLTCLDNEAHTATLRSVKKTLRNKLPRNTKELKGNNLSLTIKKYFLKEMNAAKNWSLYAAIADKKSWIIHHKTNHNHTLKNKTMYDEVARRVFAQLDSMETVKRVDIVVDRSKNKGDIIEFNNVIITEIKKQLSKNAKLTIRHANSHEEAGLQAVDLFCHGIAGKYEKNDTTWYLEFSDRIAVETKYKF